MKHMQANFGRAGSGDPSGTPARAETILTAVAQRGSLQRCMGDLTHRPVTGGRLVGVTADCDTAAPATASMPEWRP